MKTSSLLFLFKNYYYFLNHNNNFYDRPIMAVYANVIIFRPLMAVHAMSNE